MTVIRILQLRHMFSSEYWITCLYCIVTLLHKNEAVMDSMHFFMMNSLCVAQLNYFHGTNALDST